MEGLGVGVDKARDASEKLLNGTFSRTTEVLYRKALTLAS